MSGMVLGFVLGLSVGLAVGIVGTLLMAYFLGEPPVEIRRWQVGKERLSAGWPA